MHEAKDAIWEALAHVKVIDPHCHLRLYKPSADNLADIVLYHHLWIELVSSGMAQHEVTKAGLPQELADPEMAPRERVRRALPYLKHVRSTTVGVFLRWILHDLYGVEDELDEQNVDRVFDMVQEKAQDGRWQEEVLQERCGIEASISVELAGSPYSPRMHKGKEGLLGWLVHYGKLSLSEWLALVEQSSGHEISSADDYREHLRRTIKELPLAEYRFVGLNAPACLTHERASEPQVTRTLQRIKVGEYVNQTEVGGLAYFGMLSVLEALRGTPIKTIQFFTGAQLLPPATVHRSVTQWAEGFCGALGRIATLHPDLHFNVSVAADIYTQDLGTLAKHVPNISVAGYWWHTLYPFYIRKAIETRLDMVPLDKIIMYFSDAYRAEWCYPKLKMIKQILGDILAERVEKGWYGLATALDIIKTTFCDNPRAIYRLEEEM